MKTFFIIVLFIGLMIQTYETCVQEKQIATLSKQVAALTASDERTAQFTIDIADSQEKALQSIYDLQIITIKITKTLIELNRDPAFQTTGGQTL